MSPDQDEPELEHALPSDIVRCIAEHLQDSSATLASLCLADRQSLELVLPLLYSRAHLKTAHSITGFCNSIINSHRNLGRHTKSLYFDPPDPGDGLLHPIVYPICSVLQRTPSLNNLSLCIDLPNTLVYECLQSNAPFSLIQFTCYNPPRTDPLIKFFTTQPSITHLTIYEPTLATSSHTRPSGYIRSLPANTLPNLKFICANPLTVHALLPGRPITHIDTDRATLFNATTYLLCEGLKQSTAPDGIQSMAVCIPQTRFWTGASDFMTRLAVVCGSCLRELRLTMTDLSVGMANLRDYAPLVEVLVASLAGFDRLEKFQFDDVLVEIMTPEILVEGLGEVGTLAYWKEQIKTLNGVTLFGIKLT